MRIAFDNTTLQTSLFFLGNSVYAPSGFAPSRRSRMDDGLIDIRILETGRRFARVRVLTSLMLGRLVRSPLYHELRVPEFSFVAVDGPTPVAHDGEVENSCEEATFKVLYRALPVFRPWVDRPGDGPSSQHGQTPEHPQIAQRPAGQHVGGGVVHVEHHPPHPRSR